VDVTKDDRVQYGARTYQVVDVDNAHNMGEFLTLTLKLVE
jgi:head-tail adaptor